MPDGERFEILKIGAQGDGVAEGPGGPRFVPFALPGEFWQDGADGRAVLATPSNERVKPPCPHFEACGGCVAQHMSDALYGQWKSGLVKQALAHQGSEIELRPLWRAPAGSRRRVVWSAERRRDGGVAIGFRAAGSHELIEISTCTIAEPQIVAMIPVVRELLEVAAGEAGLRDAVRVNVLRADNGIDIAIEDVGRDLAAGTRQRLAGKAQQSGVLRLSIDGGEIFQNAVPVLRIGDAEVRVPAGAFVQAVGAAEEVMAAIAVKALGRAKHVADLFCGLGTFSLVLARRARVLAADNAADAVAVLEHAVRHTKGLKPVECRRRDLFREPLSRGELRDFDGVVFDPPRAGAVAQAEALAKSKVPVVIAVSCNPATMARDLRILIDGGYRLESVTPIDQFLYSAHVEAVAVLRR